MTQVSLFEALRKRDWIPDSARTRCRICTTKFNLLTRRHHCRAWCVGSFVNNISFFSNSAEIFCDNCSSHRLPGTLATSRAVTMLRVCNLCWRLIFYSTQSSAHWPEAKLKILQHHRDSSSAPSARLRPRRPDGREALLALLNSQQSVVTLASPTISQPSITLASARRLELDTSTNSQPLELPPPVVIKFQSSSPSSSFFRQHRLIMILAMLMLTLITANVLLL